MTSPAGRQGCRHGRDSERAGCLKDALNLSNRLGLDHDTQSKDKTRAVMPNSRVFPVSHLYVRLRTFGCGPIDVDPSGLFASACGELRFKVSNVRATLIASR